MGNGCSYIGIAVGAAGGVYAAGFVDGKSNIARAVGAAIGAVVLGFALGAVGLP
jgi:hypothetical protein